MREYLAERLGDMKSLKEREILKELMSNVFLPMYDETEVKYAALERRVRDELPLQYGEYTVYCTVLPREQLSGHAYLSPVIAAEEDGVALKTNELKPGQTVIDTIFYEADYLKCQRVNREKRILDGAFVIGGKQYPFKFQLRRATRYNAPVKKLHSSFLQNDVPWTTVNCAYFNKFFDVVLTDIEQLPPSGVIIQPSQIELSFDPYSDFKRGLIPVWNVDIHHAKGEDFPTPVLDTVNFEYHFDVNLLGAGCGFLVDYENAYILHTRREDGTLVIASPKRKELLWDMYRFRPRRDTQMDFYPYPILSNARRDDFATRLLLKFGTHITTKAELRRLLTAFETSEYVELLDIRFAGEKLAGDTYDMNPFIIDEIRDPNFQKTLVLSFKAVKQDFFLTRDIISFLASELQTAYPEYRCVGVLV